MIFVLSFPLKAENFVPPAGAVGSIKVGFVVIRCYLAVCVNGAFLIMMK